MRAIKIIALILLINSFAYSQQWSKITTTGNVLHLKNHSAIYHPPTNRMIVFGGRTAVDTVSGELWSLNLTTNQWTQLTPTGISPEMRYSHNAHYDSLNNRMIIWSGRSPFSDLLNDVWAYNFASNSWQELWPDGNTSGVPLKRYGTASVFDPVNRQFVTFAGFTNSGRFEDTWTFNVDNLSWQDRTNNPHPPKRCLHTAVFARDQRKMVMYAGQNDAGPLDDIWTLNIDNFAWQNVTPQFRPSARFWNSTIYSGNGNVIIFGGLGSIALADMWKFSLSTYQWEIVNQGSTVPGARWGHSGIYIPSQDRMIIFGGEGDSLYTDTWQYSNVSAIGIQQVSQNIPKNFSLEQNYPNPFNPMTNVKFQIPNAGFVKLIIFDITGRQITTLVNGNLEPGTYKVDWNASNYPSGVYFYRIETSAFTQTRKMILIK
jgi:hypothetical protein